MHQIRQVQGFVPYLVRIKVGVSHAATKQMEFGDLPHYHRLTQVPSPFSPKLVPSCAAYGKAAQWGRGDRYIANPSSRQAAWDTFREGGGAASSDGFSGYLSSRTTRATGRTHLHVCNVVS